MKLLSRFLLMTRKHWGTLFVAVLGIIGAALLNLVTPEIVRRLITSLSSPANSSSGLPGSGSASGSMTPALLLAFVLILIGAYLVRALCRFISMYVSHLAAWRFVGELTLMVYGKLQQLSLRYFQDKQTGQLMSRMVNDTRQLEVLVAHAIPDLISNVVVIVGVAVMMFRINPFLALITLIPVPFVVFAGSVFSRKVAPLFRINQEVLGDLNGTLQDNLSGMKEIQAFNQEDNEYSKMEKVCVHYSYVNIRANFANAIFHPGVEFITSLGTVIVVGVGGYLAMRQQMALSDIVGFLLYLSLFYQPLAILARLVEDTQVAYAGGARVFEVLDAESDILEAPDAIRLGRTKGAVSFEKVSFHYNAGEDVLKHVSFSVKPGQMIALVGPTGVGKTTIVSLLERFYDPVEGMVSIDGTDIRNVTLNSLRDQISIVLQDVFLFNGSIADNIAYGMGRDDKISHEEIIRAAKIAHADGFISRMPNGYQTLVGERGVRLSGGQKQRIAIARAILRDTPILILDEATSAVDTETESEIRSAIESIAGTRTVVVIAHRLSTVMNADTILVLDEGEITERGNHRDLLALDGLYAKLCRAQWTGENGQFFDGQIV